MNDNEEEEEDNGNNGVIVFALLLGARQAGIDHAELMSALWERAHRNRMLDHGAAYAERLPRLDWMLCGQWPMEFRERRRAQPGATKQAVPCVKERNTCRTLLRRLLMIRQDND